MKTTLLYSIATLTLAACSSGRTASAQVPVQWSVAPVRGTVQRRAITNVHIDAKIQGGWHIYSITQPSGGPIATRITVPVGQPFVLAGTPQPSVPPRVAFDDAFHMNVQLHDKSVGFTVPIRFTGMPTAASAHFADSVHVTVRYQVCNASLCFPPQTVKLATPIAVKAR